MAKIGIDYGTTNSSIVGYDSKNVTKLLLHTERSVIASHESGEGSPKHDFLNHDEKVKDVLKQLIQRAVEDKAESLGIDLSQAVFTVPLKFTARERKHLRKLARQSGINVTYFVHEPFAALVGFFETNEKYGDATLALKNHEREKLLVFDWGGGTLDIVVAEISKNRLDERSMAELPDVAGEGINAELLMLVGNKMVDSGLSKEICDKIIYNNLGQALDEAERVKIQLSEREESNFFMEYVLDGELSSIDEVITRSEFEEAIEQEFVAKAIEKVEEALEKSLGDVDSARYSQFIQTVLVTGGSSNIPVIQRRLKEMFPKSKFLLDTRTKVPSIIAIGAAVIAEKGWHPRLTADIMVGNYSKEHQNPEVLISREHDLVWEGE